MHGTGAIALVGLLCLAAAPGEEDLSFADAAPAEATDAQVLAAHVAQTTRVVPYGPTLELSAGDTAFVEFPVRLTRPLPERPRVVPLGIRAPRGLWVAPFGELGAPTRGGVLVRYAVRATSAEPGAQLSLQLALEVRGPDDAPAGRAEVEQTVKVTASAPSVLEIEADRAAFIALQAVAQKAAEALPELKHYLRLDRVDRPPSPGRVPAEKDSVLERFLAHRLRADVARARLRHAADAKDPALATAAARAIGALSDKPTGPAARARAIEGVTTDQALALARRALDDLQVDEAEGFLNKLRTSGRLEHAELAETLALLAAVSYLRGRDAAAARLYGAARCLDPALRVKLTRPALQARFQEASGKAACEGALAVSAVTVERRPADDGVELVVDARLADDPHGLVSGGQIELWGFGGALDKSQKVRAEQVDGAPHLVARFSGEPDAFSYDVALVKVLAQDVSGVVLATYGDPDPVSVPVKDLVDAGVKVPGWVWWVATGVAVVGGATAVGVWAAGRDTSPTRSIGPIDVRF